MKKLLKFFDAYGLKILVCFLILFTALYPKLPSIHIIRTWVYIRLEDFAIAATVIIWIIQLLRRKVTLPGPFATAIGTYWAVGLISVIFSILFIGPHLSNFFPHLALLSFARRVEYMILFFVAFSTIKSYKDVKDYLIILGITIFGIFLYGAGQRYYLFLWEKFPDFFRNYSFCFPSFQTGNEEFAKGIPLCLPQGARINSTFGGHYDLAAYLVLVLPVIIGVFIGVKRRIWKIMSFLLFISGLLLMLFTASRTSFMAYILGAIFMLVLYKKKLFIIPVVLISFLLLMTFSESTAKRLISTFRISSVVINNQGQVVGEVLPEDLKNKISKVEGPPPAQDLQVGSAIIGLPSATTSTNSALVKKVLSPEEIKRMKLAEGSIELSTVNGSFQVKKALVYDISFTTRFQAEWPNAWKAFMRNPVLGSGYSTITLATDNDYMRALGETGALGLLSFVLIFIVLGIAMKELLPQVTSSVTRGFIFGLSGGVIGLALNAVLIDVFEASKVAENLWILLGIGAGALYIGKAKKVDYIAKLKTVFTSHIAFYCYMILLAIAYFSASMNNFFVADDFTWLRWAASSTLPDIVTYFTNSENFFYRPLDKTITLFLYNIFAFRPQNYHLFTIFLHLLATIVIYRFSFKLLKSKLLAFLTAFIFLAHPIHSENLYWFSTISVTLGSLFLLYATNAFYNFRKNKSKVWYVAAFIFGVLAFLSYEIAVVLPLLLLCVDFFISKPTKKLQTFLQYIPFILLIPGYFLVRHLTHAFTGGGDYSYSLPNFVQNVLGNSFGYLGLFLGGMDFLPWYGMLRDTMRTNQMLFLVSAVIIVIILGTLLWRLKGKLLKFYKSESGKLVAFGIVFAFASLLPYLALGNVAERYIYLASFGLSLATVVILSKIFKKSYWFMVILVFALGVWYFFANSAEQKKWHQAGEITKTTISLFRTDYETIPASSRLYFVHVPVKHNGVWVFPVGLDDGLWFIYQNNLPQIFVLTQMKEIESILLENDKNTHIFNFDKNGKIEVIK